MSMPTILTADPDDFRQWEIELNPRLRDEPPGPKIPAQRSRAAENRDADAQAVEGYLEWLHDRGRRD